jgi:uncharacterized protein (TIGR03083 family)
MSEHAEIRTELENNRQELLAVLANLSEGDWATAVYAEDSQWTVADLLRHLTDSEAGMITLMTRIRDGGEGVPEDFDLDRWNASRVKKAQAKTPADLMADLATNRANLLNLMDSLEEADWDKKGRHGSGRILSLAEICQVIAAHDRTHAQDIRTAVG